MYTLHMHMTYMYLYYMNKWEGKPHKIFPYDRYPQLLSTKRFRAAPQRIDSLKCYPYWNSVNGNGTGRLRCACIGESRVHSPNVDRIECIRVQMVVRTGALGRKKPRVSRFVCVRKRHIGGVPMPLMSQIGAYIHTHQRTLSDLGTFCVEIGLFQFLNPYDKQKGMVLRE